MGLPLPNLTVLRRLFATSSGVAGGNERMLRLGYVVEGEHCSSSSSQSRGRHKQSTDRPEMVSSAPVGVSSTGEDLSICRLAARLHNANLRLGRSTGDHTTWTLNNRAKVLHIIAG